MLDFLISNIFAQFGKGFFQLMIGIPMSNNCAFFLADLFLHAFKPGFRQGLHHLNYNEEKASQHL